MNKGLYNWRGCRIFFPTGFNHSIHGGGLGLQLLPFTQTFVDSPHSAYNPNPTPTYNPKNIALTSNTCSSLFFPSLSLPRPPHACVWDEVGAIVWIFF